MNATTQQEDRPGATNSEAANSPDKAENNSNLTAKEAYDVAAETPPESWPMAFDFDSDRHAALYWASLGFEVRPAGWAADAWLTRPEDVAVAWSGAYENNGVVTRAPRGTLAVGYWPDALTPHELDAYEPGSSRVWDARPPHRHRPTDGPPVLPTLTVRNGIVGDGLTVHLYAYVGPLPTVAHLPGALMTTPYRREPFPLPSRTGCTTIMSGTLRPLPAHLGRLLSPEPLPCREQDDKGYTCDGCQRHGNARPADFLEPRWRHHVLAVVA